MRILDSRNVTYYSFTVSNLYHYFYSFCREKFEWVIVNFGFNACRGSQATLQEFQSLLSIFETKSDGGVAEAFH